MTPAGWYRRLLAALVIALLMPYPAAALPGESAVVLNELDGLGALFRRVQRHQGLCRGARASAARSGSADRAAGWEEFQSVASAVLGRADASGTPAPAEWCAVLTAGRMVVAPASAGVRRRDRVVGRMHMLGYTAAEIADVVSGAIPLRALRQAARMQAVGYGAEAIGVYLGRHYRGRPQAPIAARPQTPPVSKPPRKTIARPQPAGTGRLSLEHHVERHARANGVDPDLVRAIILHESSWRPAARSPAGATGLMQLMPGTAEMLGVDDPHDPEQNIAGGVRYLAGLLRMFDGDLEAALVGYNAGPAFARKWRRGDAVLYGETRAYLNRIKQTYASYADARQGHR